MRKEILLLLFLVLLSFKGHAQPKAVLTLDDNNFIVGKYLHILEDNSSKLSVFQALRSKNYVPNSSKVPNLGFTEGVFWVKLLLENQTPDSHYILQINQALLDEVTLYEFSADSILLRETSLGEKFNLNQRKYKDNYLLFDVNIPKGKQHIFLLKIISGEQILLPLQISTLDTALERNRNRDLLFGIYFGIIFVMMAYNFFIYFSVKDRSYLYYVFYIFAVGFTQAVLEGYTLKFLWPGNFWLASRSVYFSTSWVCISSIIFLRFFLHTKELAPKLDKFFQYIFLAFVVCVIANAIVVNSITHNFTQVIVGLVSFSLLITSLVIYRKGFRPAKFFLLAWIVLIIGIFVFVMKDAGILEANILTTYTLQIGSVIEVILLSFALADRINIFKKEKEETQAELIKVVSEQNVVLEEKVRIRTEELEEKNDELAVTLSDLKETQSQLLMVEKMASLGQLTAGIAHEINNPINFVSANIRPLKMDIADILDVLDKYDDIKYNDESIKTKLEEINSFKEQIDLDYVKTEINTLLAGIEDGAKRTAEIVKGLKNFSHLDESDIKLANVNTGIESTLVLLRSSIPENIAIDMELGDIPLIECYPGKLNQVIMNILNNAIQAMEKNKETLNHTLAISSFLKDEQVHICIEDTGVGMTKEVKDKVFDPFFTTKDVGEGTGLGMSIAFGIIESHQGAIEIDSVPGKGTKVTLKLPLKLRNDSNIN